MIAFFIYRKEGNAEEEAVLEPAFGPSKKYFGYCIGLIMLFLFVSRWLSVFEIISFNLVLIPILGLSVWTTFQAVTLPPLRLGTLGLMILSLFFMNQTYPEYGKKDNKLSYWTIGFGILTGNTHSYLADPHPPQVPPGTCVSSNSIMNDNDFSVKAIGVSHVKQIDNTESLILGMNGFWGTHGHNYFSNSTTINESNSTFGFSPYFQYNWEHIGIGGGFSVGNFTRMYNPENMTPTSTQKLNFYPSFILRAGRIQTVSFEYRFANQFPSPFPALTHQVSVVMAMGKRGGAFRIGTGSNAGLIIAPSFSFGEHVILEPLLTFGTGLFNNDGADDHSSNMYMISMHYKFNRRETPIK